MSKTKYVQAALPFDAAPEASPHAVYLDTLAQARKMQDDQAACQSYLQQSLDDRLVTIHDVRTIWRGLYSIYFTPFG